jgi:hypothetical protein
MYICILSPFQITSICFSPDGTTVAGGLIHGRVYFYDLIDFDQLKYKTQVILSQILSFNVLLPYYCLLLSLIDFEQTTTNTVPNTVF